MSHEFYQLNQEAREAYEVIVNQMLENIANNETFTATIRNLCTQALKNNWTLDKKINIMNIIQ